MTGNSPSEPLLCVDTKMERREDGIAVTYILADGRHLEQYMNFQEFFEFAERFKAMVTRE